MRAASVGLRLYDPRVDDLQFRSRQTWIGRDVLLLRMVEIFREYGLYGTHTYRGAPSLSEDESARIREDFRRRRSELAEMLTLGRTVVIFLAPPEHWFVDTGERTYSGTGRNRQATRIVDEMTLYSLLPFEVKAAPASTRELELVGGEPFAGFWRVMRGKFEATARLTADFGSPTLKIAGTEAVVGSIFRAKGGGVVILLPQDLLYSDESNRVAPPGELDESDEERSDGAEVYTNDEPDQADEPHEDDEDDDEEDEDDEDDEDDDNPLVEDVEFLDALFELIRGLRVDAGDFEQPAWASEFTFELERAATASAVEAERVASETLAALDAAKSRAAEFERRKTLVTGTGRAFEIVVEEAFSFLGFTVTEGAPGRTDRVMHYEGSPPVVVEAKGRASSAAEADAAQLEKWVSEYYLAEGVQPKALLVVNAWRDVPLSERTEDSFPHQMIGYASGRGHCLLTGAQLLGAWLDVEQNPSRREEVVAALYATVGRFPLYDDWPDFLERQPAVTDAAERDEEPAAES